MRETPERALSSNPSKDWVDMLSCCLGHRHKQQSGFIPCPPSGRQREGLFPFRKVMSNIPRASFCSWGLDCQGHGEPDPFGPSNRGGPQLLVRAVHSQTPWAKAQPLGAHHRALSPGLASGNLFNSSLKLSLKTKLWTLEICLWRRTPCFHVL